MLVRPVGPTTLTPFAHLDVGRLIRSPADGDFMAARRSIIRRRRRPWHFAVGGIQFHDNLSARWADGRAIPPAAAQIFTVGSNFTCLDDNIHFP